MSLKYEPASEPLHISVTSVFDAAGPKLHSELLEYDKDPARNSYLEEFWEDAYLTAR